MAVKSSSVATGGARAPLPSTGMATGFVQIRDFSGGLEGGRVVTAVPQISQLCCPSQKPHPRIGPSGHVLVCPGIFLHPFKGVNTPYFLRTPPTSGGHVLDRCRGSTGHLLNRPTHQGRQRLSHSLYPDACCYWDTSGWSKCP